MQTTTGTITAQNANPNSGAATTGSTVGLQTSGQQKTLLIQVTGTWSGALTLQETLDGTNWVANGQIAPITTGTNAATIPSGTAGIYIASIAGAIAVRLSSNAATTGTAVVTMAAVPL
jgi:hypothetical protein